MKTLRRRRWVAATALSALLTGQVATPLVQAQTEQQRRQLPESANVPVQAGSVVASPAASPSAPTHTASDDRSSVTRTPIKHVILIIGENRTFDHVFATYTPPSGQTVFNLLSEGIVDSNGNPATNFNSVQQWQATDTTTYSNSPTKTTVYRTLPQMNTAGAPTDAHFSSVAAAQRLNPRSTPQKITLFYDSVAPDCPTMYRTRALRSGIRRTVRCRWIITSLTTIMLRVRFTGSFKCGNRRTAMPATLPRKIPAVV